MANTALGAEKKDSRTITFKNSEHEKFYRKYLSKCRYQDVYHKALVYCLGIDRDTRNYVDGRPCMLKIRLQGTIRDIQWFKHILERHEDVKVIEVSKPFTNKGTNKYFRVYVEVENNGGK